MLPRRDVREAELSQNGGRGPLLRQRVRRDHKIWQRLARNFDELGSHTSCNSARFVFRKREVGNFHTIVARRRRESTGSDAPPGFEREIADPGRLEAYATVQLTHGYDHAEGMLVRRRGLAELRNCAQLQFVVRPRRLPQSRSSALARVPGASRPVGLAGWRETT